MVYSLAASSRHGSSLKDGFVRFYNASQTKISDPGPLSLVLALQSHKQIEAFRYYRWIVIVLCTMQGHD